MAVEAGDGTRVSDPGNRPPNKKTHAGRQGMSPACEILMVTLGTFPLLRPQSDYLQAPQGAAQPGSQGAAQAGAQGAAQPGSAGAQQLGAGAQQSFFAQQPLWCFLNQPIRPPQHFFEPQGAGAQQAFGAGAQQAGAQAAGAAQPGSQGAAQAGAQGAAQPGSHGAAQPGSQAGAQHVGSGQQVPFLWCPKSPAFAVLAAANRTRAAVKVVHFILKSPDFPGLEQRRESPARR